MLSLAGACLGFLRYNYHPARVFLGDTGSLFIGFSIAALSLATRSKAPAIAALGMPLLAVGVPLFDTVLAVWRRSVRRYTPEPTREAQAALHRADADHLHHRLVRRGHPVRRVAWMLYVATILLTVIGLSATVFYDRLAGILAVAFVCAVYTIFRHAASIELRESGRAVLRGIHRPVRRNRTMMLYLLADIAILAISSLFSFLLLRGPDGLSSQAGRHLLMQVGGLDIAITTLVLLGFRSYSRVWYLARVSEYAAIGLAVLLGGIVSTSVRILIDGATSPGLRELSVQSLLFCVFAAPGVLGVRVALRVVQDLMQWRSIHDAPASDRVSVLVAGTGYRTTLFLRQHNWNPDVGPAERIAGLVSDDPEMKGHFIHGHRVLGTIRELPALIAQVHSARIYIVEDFNEAALQTIRDAASSRSVRVTRWKMAEEDLPPVESLPSATIRRGTDE